MSEHVSHASEPEESLADIKLEDRDLDKQLDDFLGPNLQVSNNYLLYNYNDSL